MQVDRGLGHFVLIGQLETGTSCRFRGEGGRFGIICKRGKGWRD